MSKGRKCLAFATDTTANDVLWQLKNDVYAVKTSLAQVQQTLVKWLLNKTNVLSTRNQLRVCSEQ